ncbi:membrane protein insertion efficiency factor YidD [bacterium]|nr:membrane protein insertion efficiency factor YidD [bacterium]
MMAIFFIKLYKKVIAPVMPPTCRFTPTCSTYSLEAFQKYGFFKGMYLTIHRILRCNPFCEGGHDPLL